MYSSNEEAGGCKGADHPDARAVGGAYCFVSHGPIIPRPEEGWR